MMFRICFSGRLQLGVFDKGESTLWIFDQFSNLSSRSTEVTRILPGSRSKPRGARLLHRWHALSTLGVRFISLKRILGLEELAQLPVQGICCLELWLHAHSSPARWSPRLWVYQPSELR